MRESLKEKVSKLETMFVREDEGIYTLMFHNTRKVIAEFFTEDDLEDFIDEMFTNGLSQNGRLFYK